MLKSARQSLVETGLRLPLAPLQPALSQSVTKLTAGALQGSLPGGFSADWQAVYGLSSAPSSGGRSRPGQGQPALPGHADALRERRGGAAPTYFPLGCGLGLIGEQGAKAVMPLARGPDGRLGMHTGGGQPVSVTVNISTSVAESFHRSKAQVSAALARAVARGQRGI